MGPNREGADDQDDRRPAKPAHPGEPFEDYGGGDHKSNGRQIHEPFRHDAPDGLHQVGGWEHRAKIPKHAKAQGGLAAAMLPGEADNGDDHRQGEPGGYIRPAILGSVERNVIVGVVAGQVGRPNQQLEVGPLDSDRRHEALEEARPGDRIVHEVLPRNNLLPGQDDPRSQEDRERREEGEQVEE